MPSQPQLDATAGLAQAILNQDAAMVEDALLQSFAVGLHAHMSPFLIELAEAHWHTRHEDVVLALQRLRSPEAVDALERVAQTIYAYLDYDEFYALARKCTWALADIGTSKAYQALERLTQSSNPTIANYATKRLTQWQVERYRKTVND